MKPVENPPRKHQPRIITWEVTKKCNLNCRHCRAVAADREFSGEFTTEECFKVLDNVASFATPIIILTGSEPMTRDDIYEIAGTARAFATTGDCLDEEPYCVYVPVRTERGDEAVPSHGIGNSPLPSQ